MTRRTRLVLATTLTTGVIAAGVWLRCGPLPAGLLDPHESPSLTVVDRHGEVLYEARSSLGTRGDALRPEDVPPTMRDATIAAEDVRFMRHVGVDPFAIARASWRNLRARRVVEGGSTITQQVAELLLRQQHGVAARGWWAKAREAVIALRLEHRLTKAEIMARYLSLAPYGNQITGAARASQAYFSRPLESLTVAETAFLAALPQQPSRFNPWRRPDAARTRQLRIIGDMASRKLITAEAAGVAKRERLVLSREQGGTLAPHYVQRVLAGVDRASGVRRIVTTLDAELQRTIAGVIRANRESLDEHGAHNVAVAVLDNHTGEWLAWEGSGDYNDQKHGGAIDGVTSPHQPGSALKPFTYAAAFERGVHPGRVLADVPTHFPTAQPGILYEPRNYDGQYRGPLLARFALAGSENIPAVTLASEIGVPAVARMLRQAGFSTLDSNASHYGLGLTLGNAEVRLDDMVEAYAMLARGGVAVRSTTRVLSERTAFFIADILSDNDARSFAFGRGGSLEFPFSVAAKTGTSQAYRDNWAVGFTRDVTVGVWVGNFDRAPMRGSSGVTGAGPIFHEVMMAAVERLGKSLDDLTPVAAPTHDVKRVDLCAMSGLAPGDACPTRVQEWVPGEARIGRCTWHHASDEGLITVWPDEYRNWAAQQLPAQPHLQRAALAPVTAARGLQIVNPLGGATYLYDPTLRPEFQTLRLRARGTDTDVSWEVDGERVGTTNAAGALEWPLKRGEHRIVATDGTGSRAETRITVR